MFLALFLFAFSFSFSFSFTAHAQDKIFNAQTATLDNGLQVIVVENDRAPVVHHMIWYKVGAAQEYLGKSGVAHYLEHMMFKGTDTLKPGEFSHIIRRLGGRDNAFTSYDFTAYFQTIAKDHLETVMRMEAERMYGIKPLPEDVVSEREVVLEERRQRTDNDPTALFFEQLRTYLFAGGHPYGRPIIGWKEEVDHLRLPDLKQFYDTWYAPNNAVLVVTGDIDFESFIPLAEKIYGVLPPKDVPDFTWPALPAFKGQAHVNMTEARIREPLLAIGRHAPSFAQNRSDALSLQVLQDMLSSGSSTYLYQTLVVQQKRAVSISLSYNPSARDTGTLWISATPAQNIALEELEDDIGEALAAFEPTEDGLQQAKTRLKDAAIFVRDSLSSPGYIIGQALATGNILQDVETWPQQIEAVTLEDVKHVLQKYILAEDRYTVTGHLKPAIQTEVQE